MKLIGIISLLYASFCFATVEHKSLAIDDDSDFYKDFKVNVPKFNFNKLISSVDKVVYSDTVSFRQSAIKKEDMYFVSFDEENIGQAQNFHDAVIELAAESIDLTKRKVSKLGNFEVEFMDSEDESFSDSGSTQILFKDADLFQDIRTVKVKERDHITLNSMIEYVGSEVFISFPMFEKNSFYKRFEEYSDRGYLLVELDQNVEMSDINVEFDKKYYLDNKYNIVNPEKDDYLFELYAGVKLGNIKLDYFHNSKIKYTKFSHVYDGELTFENGLIEKDKAKDYSFLVTNIYGVDETLSLSKKQIFDSVVDTDLNVKDSKIRLKVNNYLTTQRKVFEIKFDEESIYVGSKGKTDLSIPSKEFSDKILNLFEIENMQYQCVLQINLDDSYNSVYTSGYAGNQYLNQDIQYLDVDGQFYTDLTRESKKMFIRTYLDDFDGIIFVELTKVNGEKRNLTTFCSAGSYLVEHL